MAADDDDVLSELTNKEAAMEDGAASRPAEGDAADVAELRARIRQLELQQSLMDSELESMSDLAKQSDAQLRQGPLPHHLIYPADPMERTHNKHTGVPLLSTPICNAPIPLSPAVWAEIMQRYELGMRNNGL